MINGTFRLLLQEPEGNRQVRQARSRRQFLQAVGAGAAAALASGDYGYGADQLSAENQPEDSEHPQPRAFELGLASYTLRKFTLE